MTVGPNDVLVYPPNRLSPVPVSATIATDGVTLTWEFSQNVFGNAVNGFSLSGSTVESGVRSSGRKLVQTIELVEQGATVTGSYSSGTGNLKNGGRAVASFSAFPITNNSEQGGGPATYALDATLEEIQMVVPTALRPDMSNGDLTAAVTMETSLADTEVHFAFPTGLPLGASSSLDASDDQAGEVRFTIDSLPAITPSGSADGFGVNFNIATPVGVWLIAQVRLLRRTNNALEYVVLIPGQGSDSGTLGSDPGDVAFLFNGPAGTLTVEIGGVPIMSDVPYTPQEIVTVYQVEQYIGFTTTGSPDLISTLSFDLPIVGP